MTDGSLMDADCVHGVVWWDCDECDDNFLDLNADVIEPATRSEREP